jgi:hypothetical protein
LAESGADFGTPSSPEVKGLADAGFDAPDAKLVCAGAKGFAVAKPPNGDLGFCASPSGFGANGEGADPVDAKALGCVPAAAVTADEVKGLFVIVDCVPLEAPNGFETAEHL